MKMTLPTLVLSVADMIRNGKSKDDVCRHVFESKLVEFSAIAKFLKDNEFVFPKEIGGWRQTVIDGFQNNPAMEKDEFEALLKSTKLKSTRIDEYVRYFYDMFSDLVNLHIPLEEEVEAE